MKIMYVIRLINSIYKSNEYFDMYVGSYKFYI